MSFVHRKAREGLIIQTSLQDGKGREGKGREGKGEGNVRRGLQIYFNPAAEDLYVCINKDISIMAIGATTYKDMLVSSSRGSWL